MSEPGQVEFTVRVVAASAAGGIRRQDAVGADDTAGVLFPDDQVLAMGIVEVPVDARRTGGQAGAHFVGKDTPTQLLGGKNIRLTVRQTHVETLFAGNRDGASDADIRMIHVCLSLGSPERGSAPCGGSEQSERGGHELLLRLVNDGSTLGVNRCASFAAGLRKGCVQWEIRVAPWS